MFADDVSCFADSGIGLQRLLNELEIFCKFVGIYINLDKTKIIVFRNGVLWDLQKNGGLMVKMYGIFTSFKSINNYI